MAVFAVAFGLVACGSSSSSSNSSSSTTSSSRTTTGAGPAGAHAAYIVKADAVCRSTEPQAAAFRVRIHQENARHDTAALTKTLNELADAAAAEQARLRALTAPPALRPLVDRFLAAGALEISLLRQLNNANAHHDQAALQNIAPRLSRVSAVRHGLARRIGYRACGRST